MLCIPELRTQWVSENTVLPAVHACMRAAGNCDALHFHHLRHSCATWMLLKLVGIGAPTTWHSYSGACLKPPVGWQTAPDCRQSTLVKAAVRLGDSCILSVR
ncbi:hypothetical protein UMZ34_07320 [Halopseudomonas pachastrellae]|nr:hypothetical protein UMZ34_07320 [Halopseudomonas pachastrellae]